MKLLLGGLVLIFVSVNSWAGILNGDTSQVFHYENNSNSIKFEISCEELKEETCVLFRGYTVSKKGRDRVGEPVNLENLKLIIKQVFKVRKIKLVTELSDIFNFSSDIWSVARDEYGWVYGLLFFPPALVVDLVKLPFWSPYSLGRSFYDVFKRKLLRRRIFSMLKNNSIKSTKVSGNTGYNFVRNYYDLTFEY